MNNNEIAELTNFIIKLQQMDYEPIIRGLNFIISCYVTKKVVDGYNLHRNYKPKNISKVALPPELTQDYSNINIEKYASQCFGNAIIEFAKVIINKFPQTYLVNFYNNINELSVEPKKTGFKNIILSSDTEAKATYTPRKKLIQVDVDNYVSTIYHELFHMASSVYKDEINYSGFRQSSNKLGFYNVGKGINEGYTQLLTERYFGYIKEVKGSYALEVHFVDKLEKIVGQEKMEKLYFNVDLPGLISELRQYSSDDEISKFITGMDFLTDHLVDRRLMSPEKNMIKNSLKNVNEFLLRTYAKKIKTELDNGALTVDDFDQRLSEYVSSLDVGVRRGKHNYEFLTADIIQDSLRMALNDPKITVENESTNNSMSK